MPAMPTLLSRSRTEIGPYRRTVAIACLPVLLWAIWVSGPSATTPAIAVAACAGVALFVIDRHTHRLPNAITYPTTAVVAVLLLGAALVDNTWDAALRAALGALTLGLIYLVLHLINPAGLGFGDVKLAVLLGMITAWYGWPALWATAMLPFLIGGFVAIALLVTRRATRKTAIAFGPFMLIGAALALTAARVVGSG